MISSTFYDDGRVLSDRNLIAGGGGCGISVSKSASDSVISNEKEYFTNTSEETVLAAENIAYYKGTLVVKVPSMGTSALSIGIIFLGSDVKSPDTVRHEYGHTRQLSQLGLKDYILWVGLPSLYYNYETRRGKYSWDQYYDRPWELLADSFGQVNRTYSTDAQKTADLYWMFVQLVSLFT